MFVDDSLFTLSIPVGTSLESFADLQDHELALWGVVRRTNNLVSILVVRGCTIGYVRAARLQKRVPEIRIEIRLTRDAQMTFGDETVQKFEYAILRGVRKCLWGVGTLPKHMVEFTYGVQTVEE